MSEIVDAKDVMDANARTKKTFRAKHVGFFWRTGPNKWDDYKFLVDDEEGEVEVSRGIRIQIEKTGIEFRMRRRGKVYRLHWIPEDDAPEELATASLAEQRDYFLDTCTNAHDETPGIGFAAAIARNLRT